MDIDLAAKELKEVSKKKKLDSNQFLSGDGTPIFPDELRRNVNFCGFDFRLQYSEGVSNGRAIKHLSFSEKDFSPISDELASTIKSKFFEDSEKVFSFPSLINKNIIHFISMESK